ncbi:MAG: type II toxin-antitoxin system HipA family toxin, partial [Spirochaetia bacterium]|nr:type II toxin-antitoxin system HipA family toxin [Spirochaetia bacterium]
MKGPSSVEVIQVSLDFGKGKIPVGRLARSQGTIYFAYESDFLERGLEISPFHLPLKPGVSAFDRFLFEGLPGVFHDSLPDGWGRLLLDRYVRSQGADPKLLTALDRLSWVGKQGLGALVYEPGIASGYGQEPLDLDLVASAVQQVLEGTAEDVLEQLLSLGGSSAGARPKALVNVSQSKRSIIHGLETPSQGFSPWLVKFPTRDDGLDAEAIEYVYALMAKDAGVEMPHVHLFPAHHGPGYFA